MPRPTDPTGDVPLEHGADDGVVVPIAAALERRRRKRTLEGLKDLEDATEAMAEDPDAPGYFTLLGNLRFLAGAYDDAIGSYSRALSFAPDDLHAREGRARARLAILEADLALADFDRALELAPDDAKLHYGRGCCLSQLIHARWERGVDDSETDDERRVRCEDALASLENAAELGLDTLELYYELLRVHEQRDDADRVTAMLDRALTIFPDEIPLLSARHSRRRLGGDAPGAEADRVRLLELGVDVTKD